MFLYQASVADILSQSIVTAIVEQESHRQEANIAGRYLKAENINAHR